MLPIPCCALPHVSFIPFFIVYLLWVTALFNTDCCILKIGYGLYEKKYLKKTLKIKYIKNTFYSIIFLFFRHQLRVKIRCDRKHLDRITFNKRWGQHWSHPSLLFLCMVMMVWVLRTPLPISRSSCTPLPTR